MICWTCVFPNFGNVVRLPSFVEKPFTIREKSRNTFTANGPRVRCFSITIHSICTVRQFSIGSSTNVILHIFFIWESVHVSLTSAACRQRKRQLIGRCWAKYRDLSLASRSIICRSRMSWMKQKDNKTCPLYTLTCSEGLQHTGRQ